MLKKVQTWLDKEYPAIAAKAKKEKAEIHWGDETGIQNTAYNAKGFALKGQPPIIRLSAKKCRINMMSTVTNNGKVRFMLYRENMTSAVLIKFMSRLIQDVHQKVILVLDNLKVHHSKLVKAWLEKHKEQIEVFYLPPYSPEHNPDDVNGDLKNRMHSGLQARTESDLTKKPGRLCPAQYFSIKHITHVLGQIKSNVWVSSFVLLCFIYQLQVGKQIEDWSHGQ